MYNGITKTQTLIACQDFAKNKNGNCLSTEYRNNREKLIWQCYLGHIWEANWGNIQRGKWCPSCNGNKKLDISFAVKIAEGRRGKLLSTVYKNTGNKLSWECHNGHQFLMNINSNVFLASGNAIKNGTWCPKCAGNKKLTIKEMRELAISKNGKCLSLTYINAKTNLDWLCNVCSTIWSTAPYSIKSGSWCPICSRKRK